MLLPVSGSRNTQRVIIDPVSISADTAIRLGAYFSLPPQFWLNLQIDYDLRLAMSSNAAKKIKPRQGAEGAQNKVSVVILSAAKNLSGCLRARALNLFTLWVVPQF